MSSYDKSNSTNPPLEDIKLIVFDVDGVLTDGSILIDNDSVEIKQFYVRDGTGIRIAQRQGIEVGILTGRASLAVTHRMNELDIKLIIQGCKDKAQGIKTLAAQAGVDLSQIAYLGDDIIDIPAMTRCGYAMAVADSAKETRDIAHYITSAKGGRGAARQAIEHILKAQGKWDEVIEGYKK